MKPQDIESLILRETGTANYTGPKARDLRRRFGLADGEIFDCDERASIAEKEAQKNGYRTIRGIQRTDDGRYHTFLNVIDKNGLQSQILMHKEAVKS